MTYLQRLLYQSNQNAMLLVDVECAPSSQDGRLRRSCSLLFSLVPRWEATLPAVGYGKSSLRVCTFSENGKTLAHECCIERTRSTKTAYLSAPANPFWIHVHVCDQETGANLYALRSMASAASPCQSCNPHRQMPALHRNL